MKITANIYADNYFEFYVNGNLVKKDPLDFTPHNAVRFEFDVPKGEKRIYAIKASDYASESGYEYINTSKPQLGDGALRIIMSDGTISTKEWKCYTTNYGPTDESISAGCSSTNLKACSLKITEEPNNWKEMNFDDSKWNNASEFTDSEAGWGMTPSYVDGKCGKRTSPLDRSEMNSVSTTSDECLDPYKISWGNSKFIWQKNLEKDNIILCRFTTSSLNSSKWLRIEIVMIIMLLILF